MNFTKEMQDLFNQFAFDKKTGKITGYNVKPPPTDKEIQEIFKSPFTEFTENGSNLVESRISAFMKKEPRFAISVNEYKIKEILETPQKSTKKYIQKKERYNNVLREQENLKDFYNKNIEELKKIRKTKVEDIADPKVRKKIIEQKEMVNGRINELMSELRFFLFLLRC